MWSLELTNGFTAVGITDILLGVLAIVLSTLTAIAGALVVADVRADVDAARVWQRINAEVTLVGSPDDTALANRFDALYAVVPQDEELRRILLAHRFEVRRPASIETKHCTPARAGTKAVDGLGGTCTDTELPNPIANVVAVTPPDAVTRPERTLSDRAPKLIASNTNRRDQSANAGNVRRRGLRCTIRIASKVRLVANAGRAWGRTESDIVAANGGSTRGFAAGVILLAADRNVGDRDQALPDSAVDATTPTQPGCRGPPISGSQRLEAAEPASGQGTFGKRHQPQIDAPIMPADLVVTDNLGDRVPIGAAELEVVETYLDLVLGELLATVASGQGHRES